MKAVGNYMLGKTIGEGTFGKVKLANHLLTGEKVAVKILEKERIVDVADVERVSREIHILKLINHPNIIRLFEVIDTPKHIYLIMEYATGGELFDYIVAHSRVKEKEAKRFFHQIVAGVEYCHKMGIIHRDLKPENLLLDVNRSIKIVDFGLSNTIKPGHLLKTACGSPCYAAPEMIAGKQYVGSGVDIWSMGVILFALICGYLPFEDANTATLYKKILSGEYAAPSFISPDAKDLIRHMLNTQPERRYTIQDIRQHPWYTSVAEEPTLAAVQGNGIIDHDIVRQLEAFGFNSLYAVKCLGENKHNHVTATYYLLVEKKLKGGLGISSTPQQQPLVRPRPQSEVPQPAENNELEDDPAPVVTVRKPQPTASPMDYPRPPSSQPYRSTAADPRRPDFSLLADDSRSSRHSSDSPAPTSSSLTEAKAATPVPKGKVEAFKSTTIDTQQALRLSDVSASSVSQGSTDSGGSLDPSPSRSRPRPNSDTTPSPQPGDQTSRVGESRWADRLSSGDQTHRSSGDQTHRYVPMPPSSLPSPDYPAQAMEPPPSHSPPPPPAPRSEAPSSRRPVQSSPPSIRSIESSSLDTTALPPQKPSSTESSGEAPPSPSARQPHPPSVPRTPDNRLPTAWAASPPPPSVNVPGLNLSQRVSTSTPAPPPPSSSRISSSASPSPPPPSRGRRIVDPSNRPQTSDAYNLSSLATYRPTSSNAEPSTDYSNWPLSSRPIQYGPDILPTAGSVAYGMRKAQNPRPNTGMSATAPRYSSPAPRQQSPYARAHIPKRSTPDAMGEMSGETAISGFITARRVVQQPSQPRPSPDMKRHTGPLNGASTSTKSPLDLMLEIQRVMDTCKIQWKQVGNYCVKCEYQKRIRFEVEVTRLENLEHMYVVRTKRITGDTWAFKDLWGQIQDNLRL